MQHFMPVSAAAKSIQTCITNQVNQRDLTTRLKHANVYLAADYRPCRLSCVGTDLQPTGTLSTAKCTTSVQTTVQQLRAPGQF